MVCRRCCAVCVRGGATIARIVTYPLRETLWFLSWIVYLGLSVVGQVSIFSGALGEQFPRLSVVLCRAIDPRAVHHDSAVHLPLSLVLAPRRPLRDAAGVLLTVGVSR